MPKLLGKEEARNINAALTSLSEAVEIIQKKEKCGLECREQKERVEGLIQQLTDIKREFIGV